MITLLTLLPFFLIIGIILLGAGYLFLKILGFLSKETTAMLDEFADALQKKYVDKKNILISKYKFEFVCSLDPERDANGKILEFFPQSRYKDSDNNLLNKYGGGPFCKFKILSKESSSGVYVLTVSGIVKYVGECKNLSERFGSRGYGAIQPCNCYKKGQATNCKINHLIFEQSKSGQLIELWFYKTFMRKSVERETIKKVSPEWNGQLCTKNPF